MYTPKGMSINTLNAGMYNDGYFIESIHVDRSVSANGLPLKKSATNENGTRFNLSVYVVWTAAGSGSGKFTNKYAASKYKINEKNNGAQFIHRTVLPVVCNHVRNGNDKR